MVIFEFTFASSSSFLQSVSIRIFQLYRNSVIRTCIASERIITIITWVITSTTYKPSGWMNGSIDSWTDRLRKISKTKTSVSQSVIDWIDRPTNQPTGQSQKSRTKTTPSTYRQIATKLSVHRLPISTIDQAERTNGPAYLPLGLMMIGKWTKPSCIERTTLRLWLTKWLLWSVYDENIPPKW